MIGIASLIDSLMSSVETRPGTMYAYLPLIMDFSLLSILGE
jgi:hypothetical protein